MLAAMPLQAGAQSNSVDITIEGGDATAIAACVNAAQYATTQQNKCDNIATAFGGNVTLKNVKIVAVASSDEKPHKKAEKKQSRPENSVTVTIEGGDATAIAACVNLAKGVKAQENKCINDAFAQAVTYFSRTSRSWPLHEDVGSRGSSIGRETGGREYSRPLLLVPSGWCARLRPGVCRCPRPTRLYATERLRAIRHLTNN